MAHPYKTEAKAGHDKKVKAYAGGNSPTAKSAKSKTQDNWDGEKPLNTNEQAGLGVIFAEPKLSQEVNPRIMRKSGGSVKGAMSLKRLDKPSRSKKADGGSPLSSDDMRELNKAGKYMKGLGRSDRDAMQGLVEKEQGNITPGEYRKGNLGKDQYALKKGGKVGHMEWEHSKEDLREDKKLAKKHGMSMEKWEKSSLDKKHDEQQSMEGLKKGGRARRADGGALGTGKSATKGGVTININDGRSPLPSMGGAPAMPPQMPPRPPMPAMGGAPAGGGMPPMGGAPMAPAPMAPMGGSPSIGGMPPGLGGTPGMGGQPGMPPRPFKRGGKVRSTQDLTAGAGSGEGRLQKEELEKSKIGRKGFI